AQGHSRAIAPRPCASLAPATPRIWFARRCCSPPEFFSENDACDARLIAPLQAVDVPKPARVEIARSGVQQRSSMTERVRGAGRNASVGLGSSGMIVMVHAAGALDLFSTIDRTWPVTADPAERTVAVLPLNWAIRKRRTSF